MSFRKEGIIPKNTQTGFPNYLVFFDTETFIEKDNTGKHLFPFKLGVAMFVKLDEKAELEDYSTVYFKSADTMFSTIYNFAVEHKKIYVFAHNIGFDLRVLHMFDRLNALDFESKPPIINERAFIWTVRHNQIAINFIDTANFAVQSVRQLGQSLGYDKLDVNFDTVTDEELMTYCERDVDILRVFVCSYINFIFINNLGKFKSTLASQALTAWRTRFTAVNIHIHSNKTAIELERKAYHGGRVEAFKLGVLPKESYYNLDVNSMYPYVMSKCYLPTKLETITHDTSISNLRIRIKKAYIIADVTVKTNIPAYPYMFKGKLIFPLGVFRTVLHHSELEYALKLGHIYKIHSILIYKREVIFKDYVDFFYPLKQQAKISGNKSWEFICKIFLNSLYGKFGQTDVKVTSYEFSKTDEIFRIPYHHIENNYKGQLVYWYGTIYDERKQGETNYSFPAIAGAITAYARMLLWSYVEISGKENAYYCDTDSIIVNESGYRNLSEHIDNQLLGKLKLEGTASIVAIRGCKDYTFGRKNKTKGKSANAITIAPDKWIQLQFEGMLAWMSNGAQSEPIARTIVKKRKGDYNKGRYDKSTGLIFPFILKE